MTKNIIKLFESFRYKHDMFRVFSDFIEVSAISISNAVDKSQFKEREDRYLQIASNYTKDELNTFADILTQVVVALEQAPNDILGRVFMELELSDDWKGQFFTPIGLAELMAEPMVEDAQRAIKNKGYFTVNDPAVGGGATIIGLIRVLQRHGINYQRYMRVIANDIDIRSVHMCYIQLSLLGVNAVLYRGDTLSLKFDPQPWRTPNNILKIFGLPKYQKPEEPIGHQYSLF